MGQPKFAGSRGRAVAALTLALLLHATLGASQATATQPGPRGNGQSAGAIAATASGFAGETFRWFGSQYNGNLACDTVPTQLISYSIYDRGRTAGPVPGNFTADGFITISGTTVTGWNGQFRVTNDTTGALLESGVVSLLSGGPGGCTTDGVSSSGTAEATLAYTTTSGSGTSFAKLNYVMRNDSPAGSVFSESFDGLTLTGTVATDFSLGNLPIAGATVSLCESPSGPCAPLQVTGPDGAYSFSGVRDFSTQRISVSPPTGSGLLPEVALRSVSSAMSATRFVKNFFLSRPKLPPPGSSITSTGTTADGVPIVFWRAPLTLTSTGCPGGSASYRLIDRASGRQVPPPPDIRSGSLTEAPAGTFTASITPLDPYKGYAFMVVEFVCPDGSRAFVGFDIYVDPSGTVRTVAGAPIPGATVTLLRADPTGAFAPVATGNPVMSPANRRNPDLTDASGHFGWDVLAGTYRVRAEHAGCVSPTDPAQSFVLSAVLIVPPAISDLDLRLSCSVGDSTPPVVTAIATPGANASGWNNTAVQVALAATDETGGSGVKQLTYSATGAQVIATTTVAGATALVTIAAEGDTTFSVFATDNAGNVSTARTLTVRIDTTSPTIAGARSPAANVAGWNNTDVTVTFTCSDARSGVATCTGPTTVSTEGQDQTATGSARDRADNTATTTVRGISIDKTAPRTTATQTPSANAAGWSRVPVTVTLSATDALAGVARTEVSQDGGPFASYAGSLRISVDGIYTLRYRSVDRAGNVEADQTLTVRIDQSAPEALISFDPATGDLAVRGADALSGVPDGAIAPLSSTASREEAVRRVYEIRDRADNTLQLVIDVKREGHELKANVVSLSYNGATAIVPQKNRFSVEWSIERGTLRELEQSIEIGKGDAASAIRAKFAAEKNTTRIDVQKPEPGTKTVRPGLVLLTITTDRGRLAARF
jgi:hypothetical protein